MNKLIMYFIIVVCLISIITGCEKTSLIDTNGNLEDDVIETVMRVENPSNGHFEPICEISCPLKGYTITINQKIVNGVAKDFYTFSYAPNNLILVDQAEHASGYVPNYRFKIRHVAAANNNGTTHKDRHGNFITGNVYLYELSNGQNTCDKFWTTEVYNILSGNPCNFSQNTIVNYLNNSQSPNKPLPDTTSNLCMNYPICSMDGGVKNPGSGHIFGMPSYYWFYPTWMWYTPEYTYNCESEFGVCYSDTYNIPDPDTYDPEVGPIYMRLTDQDEAHLIFWRDTRTMEFEIEEWNNMVNDDFKRMYGLSEEIVFREGVYPLSFENFEFGEVIIPLEGI